MKPFKTLIYSLLFCLLGITHYVYAADQTIIFKNQRGSMLKLIFQNEKTNTGSLTGTFTTNVGNCKADVGIPVPIRGYFNGNAIALIVNFPHCQQLVAMTGNLTDHYDELHTLWLDAHNVKDPVNKNWDSNIIGADSYKKVG